MAFWAVAQTESLRERTAQRWLEPSFETYLPLMRASGDRIVPLFPSYLFLRVDDHWSDAENTVGVIGLLKSGDQPSQLRDSIIGEIRKREGKDGLIHLPKPKRLKIGDAVRVRNGIFADHIGLYDGMSAHARVFVLLELFGRKTRTEFLAADVLAVAG